MQLQTQLLFFGQQDNTLRHFSEYAPSISVNAYDWVVLDPSQSKSIKLVILLDGERLMSI
jgi:hypothetical protein